MPCALRLSMAPLGRSPRARFHPAMTSGRGRYTRRYRSIIVQLSLITPCFNESQSLPSLASRVGRVLGSAPWLAGQTELILVDDGSTDETFGRMEDLRAAHPFIVT